MVVKEDAKVHAEPVPVAEAASEGPSGEAAEQPKEEDEEAKEEDEEDEYKVEAILDVKKVRGKPHYLIKWEGFDEAENSWEPEDNLGELALLDVFKATPAYKAKFEAGASSSSAKPPAKKRPREEDREYIEPPPDDDDEDAESDKDDESWGEEEDESSGESSSDSDEDGEMYEEFRRPKKKKQEAPPKRPKQVEKLKPHELAALRTRIEACDKPKLTNMIEALLAGHAELAPEVQSMLDESEDGGAGIG